MTDETDDIFQRAIAERVENAPEPRPYWELPGLIHDQEPKKRWFGMSSDRGFRSNQIGLALAAMACLALLGVGVWSLTGTSAGDDIQVTTDPTLPDTVDDDTAGDDTAGDESDDGTTSEPANTTDGESADSEPTDNDTDDAPDEEAAESIDDQRIEVVGPDGLGSGEMVYVAEADPNPDAECSSGRLGHRNADGDLHIYDNIGDVGNLRLYSGGDGQVALADNCEELVQTIIIASSSPGVDGPPQLAEFSIPTDWLMFFDEPQISYVDEAWVGDIDRGSGTEKVRFDLDTLTIVAANEPATESDPDTGDAAGQIDVGYTCVDGSTGATATNSNDPDQIDDYINSIDLCEGSGGLSEISFEAPCGDVNRPVTVGAEGGVPDIATVDYCE